jgi:hypothetical protein
MRAFVIALLFFSSCAESPEKGRHSSPRATHAESQASSVATKRINEISDQVSDMAQKQQQ